MVGVTRQAYIEDLEKLRKQISKMGMAVDKGLKDSMTALINRDTQLAKKVMLDDDVIDEMNVKIEDACMLLIAKQQPIAKDLRIIATGLKISTDLERIGDHAHDIAKIATEFDQQVFVKELVDIPQMAEYAGKMLQDAIEAYNTFDVALAEQVCLDDDKVDDLYAKTFRELSRFVDDDAAMVKQATQLIFIARYLERVADHATNIAEWVIYLVTAERIRKDR